ncbi:hypothetical protein A3C87_00680 [Candidatus Kaiserbacteria bacterium RIFCSPHIGHO2_02_FULL_49_34]|uniref:Uncharacterized protein n=1 Tax=Candidatus Kaiserbacteria bacterium RIFCSPHIGHO2_02_FULL_49_34 TaxID=1798491 RepID=A0A1F6DKP8_9BACT|nr:MAG: hypothetical protein A3C87_00680 [Candidatus Kaiserbacteria bacterium RIFCSPHIGHO2_02_FULL_49_34]
MTNIKIFGTLIVVAFLLIVGIIIRYTGAADVATTAEIINVAPTVDTIRIATTAYGTDDLTSSGILPNVGTDRTIHINGQISDANGENDIASSTLALVFHKTSSTNTCAADNNDCYVINSCTTNYSEGSDTEIAYNCEVPLAYWIDATDAASAYTSDSWTAYVTVQDFASTQGALSATVEVNSLLALNLPDVIDYGTRSLGEVSSSTTNVETVITQRGNTKADVQLSGSNMGCSALGTLATSTQAWALTDVDHATSIVLTDTPASAKRNILLRTDESNELSANLYWNIAIPASGVKGTCTGANTIAVIAKAQAGVEWTSRVSAADNFWNSVTYGNGLFVAVASTGFGNRVMTSPDGITWTSQTSAADNAWGSVTYGNGLFVAVAGNGIGDRVMTSPDGITWTTQTSAADNSWVGVTYGNGLFVAVSNDSTVNSVMTSPDGITWTSRTSATTNQWSSVTYGNGLFVAVSSNGTGDRVMTSPDGITWTTQTSAADNSWVGVTYGNGLFVAVAVTGAGNRVMTSPDGITWTTSTSAPDNGWQSVTYGQDLFVAVSRTGAGNRVMTSPDGITWTSRTSAAQNNWRGVTYGGGIFVAVSCGVGNNFCNGSAGSRVMTSD